MSTAPDYTIHPLLSDTEAKILEQYRLTVQYLTQIEDELDALILGDSPIETIRENLRALEMQLAVIHSLFPSSVFAVYQSSQNQPPV